MAVTSADGFLSLEASSPVMRPPGIAVRSMGRWISKVWLGLVVPSRLNSGPLVTNRASHPSSFNS